MDGESIQLFAALKRYQLCLIPILDSNLLGFLPQLTESPARCKRLLTYWVLIGISLCSQIKAHRERNEHRC